MPEGCEVCTINANCGDRLDGLPTNGRSFAVLPSPLVSRPRKLNVLYGPEENCVVPEIRKCRVNALTARP